MTIGDLLRWMVLIGRRVTPSGRSSAAGEHALAQRRRRRARQLGRVVRQVPDDDLVLVGGCGASGHTRARQPRSAGYMPDTCRKGRRARHADLGQHRVLAAQLQAEVPQPRLLCCGSAAPARWWRARRTAHRARPRAPGRWRRVRCSSLKRRPAVVVRRPLDALGAQRPGAAHHVEQVPAAAVVLPLARIGVDQVAPEQEARHLVVEADRVVAHADGARAGQLRPRWRRRTRARARRVPGSAAAGCR